MQCIFIFGDRQTSYLSIAPNKAEEGKQHSQLFAEVNISLKICILMRHWANIEAYYNITHRQNEARAKLLALASKKAAANVQVQDVVRITYNAEFNSKS